MSNELQYPAYDMDGDGNAVDFGLVVALREAVGEGCEGEDDRGDGHASEVGREKEVES